jgi:predicted SAM-dependent methyltransferase
VEGPVSELDRQRMPNFLNIGCGTTFHSAWTNIDLTSYSPEVIAHDIRIGLPFAENTFEACYSSHVLEHMNTEGARRLVGECYRVLKPKGIARIVVPDLEGIATRYLANLEKADQGGSDADYDWMMLELYDQTTREKRGGQMAAYITKPQIPNFEFVKTRVGEEAERVLQYFANQREVSWLSKLKRYSIGEIFQRARQELASLAVAAIAGSEARSAFAEGLFRNSGEIHRWMYDRYSLKRLLTKAGFEDVRVCAANESRIEGFNSYALDVADGKTRKPDSMFIESTQLK